MRCEVFLSYVGNFDPCPSKALRAEVPALESAITSLASASSKLADKFPQLGALLRAGFPRRRGFSVLGLGRRLLRHALVLAVEACPVRGRRWLDAVPRRARGWRGHGVRASEADERHSGHGRGARCREACSWAEQ